MSDLDNFKDESDAQHTISESRDKIVLKTNVKRGSGTRDQDKINVKVKGNDPEEAVLKLGKVLDTLRVEEIPELLRDTQPEESE